MLHWAIFLLFTYAGYRLTWIYLVGRARRVAPAAAPMPNEGLLPDDLECDLATRLLLGAAADPEVQALRGKSQTDAAFSAVVALRQGQLIRAYALGRLDPRLREAFRRMLLPMPGVAQEVEVERALHSVTGADYGRLRVQIAYRPGRIEAAWRRLTLPRPKAEAQLANGPCLMAGPMTDWSEPLVLEGRVTGVSGENIELDLGLAHGLGPGDLVEISRGEAGWIGTAVVESSEGAHSRAIFMGEPGPRVDDRAKVAFAGDSL